MIACIINKMKVIVKQVLFIISIWSIIIWDDVYCGTIMTCVNSIFRFFLCVLSYEFTLKLQVNYLNYFFFNFHIEIAYDTIELLNYVVDQLFLKEMFWLLRKLIYSYIVIYIFLVMSKILIYIFYFDRALYYYYYLFRDEVTGVDKNILTHILIS